MDPASIGGAVPTGRDGGLAGATTPRLVDNVGLVLDVANDAGMARAFLVNASTVSVWRRNMTVPLFYLSPILRLMTWEDLAHGDVSATHHAGRGWTRDPAAAAAAPADVGPVNLQFRSRFEDVMDRMRMLAGDREAFHEALNATPNQMTQWKKRSRVPDRHCMSFCDRFGLSLSWLMTGHAPDE